MRSHLSTAFLSAFLASTCLPAAEITFPHPERIKYDSQLFQIEGRDMFLYGGSFHYFRVPKELWADRFQKLKEAGFNVVETYVPWNYHESAAPSGLDDFSKLDLTELTEWMTMAEKFGFYTIIRPGPYICAEWAGGGYPRWLLPLFKPAGWPADQVWLQTDDPTYLAWNKHWYDAVAKVVAPHQITRKPAGSPGVILFQIENEYERLKWVKSDVKTRHLAAIARQSRDAGIEVPIVTCWTRQTRDSRHPDLVGVFDFINSYPKWEIGQKFRETMEKQRKEQPYAPVATMELQGGWYSEIGGKLSEQIDGIAPVQTQNLTLYCLQLGYGLINYYMLVGGTNFDDWASREATTTYDFAAALREHGGVGERYQRVAGLGALLRDHGVRIARANTLSVKAEMSDPAVQVAVRRAGDGTRYVFVRTEDRKTPHTGTAKIVEADGTAYAFDFKLEPFGSELLVLPPGVTDAAKGEWLPKRPPLPARPTAGLPATLALTTALRRADPLPTTWHTIAPGETLESKGVNHSHPLYYRVEAPAGAKLVVGRIGPKVIKSTLADGVLVSAGGRVLAPLASDRETITFQLPPGEREAVLLYEDVGLHHHTTVELEKDWVGSLRGVTANGTALPLRFASTERESGLTLSRAETPAGEGWSPVTLAAADSETASPDALMTWYRFEFELPAPVAGVWVPWHLRLLAEGNGFLYLNGRALGRHWEVGPQRDFFLPETWLNFGPGKKNIVLVNLRAERKGAIIREASVVPAVEFAETRAPGPAPR